MRNDLSAFQFDAWRLSPPSSLVLWAGGSLALWAMYSFVFYQTVPEPVGAALVDAAANVIPLCLLAFATHALLKTQLMPRPVLVQTIAHIGVAIVFATTWYALVLVCLAFVRGLQGDGYAVSGFSGPAFTWQVFQGLVIYAMVAAVCYALRGGRVAATVTFAPGAAFERYLTRTGDDILPRKVRDIVTITGAQDFAEVATLSGRHLVRMSLGEFERRLDPGRFLRVHRSTILNFDHLERAEPAGGGRLLVHMANGDTVAVSRSGAQMLRSFVV